MLTKKLTIEGWFIIFHTDSYESRIYEYESELDGVMTNQGMFGKGGRWYIIFRLGLLDNIQISGKYSETYIDGAGSIGSGNEEVKGDVKNRLAVQLELKF